MYSADLEKYKIAQSFWENFGISLDRIDYLTAYDYDMIVKIINIENQFQREKK